MGCRNGQDKDRVDVGDFGIFEHCDGGVGDKRGGWSQLSVSASQSEPRGDFNPGCAAYSVTCTNEYEYEQAQHEILDPDATKGQAGRTVAATASVLRPRGPGRRISTL